MASIDSQASVQEFRYRQGRRNKTLTIEPDFGTIYEQEDMPESDMIARQRVFEDVIIQRIKVIQDFCKRQARKQKERV